MERHERPRDREPQTRARDAVRVVTAEELVEDALAVFRGDPRTVVPYFDAERVSPAVRHDQDRRALGRVADRVDDEIGEGLLHLAAVRDDTRRIGIDVERDPLPLLLGEDRMVRDDVPDQRDGVDLLFVERDLTLFEARHLQKLGGEVLEAPDIPLGALGELPLRRGETPWPLAEKELDGATNDGERAAEVVGHRCEELALDPVGLPQCCGLDGLSHELLALRPQVVEPDIMYAARMKTLTWKARRHGSAVKPNVSERYAAIEMYASEIAPAAVKAPAVPKRKPPAMMIRLPITHVVQLGSDEKTSIAEDTIPISRTNITRVSRSKLPGLDCIIQ